VKPNFALNLLESAANKYIQLDPHTVDSLHVLNEKTIAIELTDLNIKFYITPSEGQE